MKQDCFKEYLAYIFKGNSVNVIILRGHLLKFLDLDYVRIIYALISDKQIFEKVELQLIYETIDYSVDFSAKSLLNKDKYENYKKLTEIHG